MMEASAQRSFQAGTGYIGARETGWIDHDLLAILVLDDAELRQELMEPIPAGHDLELAER